MLGGNSFVKISKTDPVYFDNLDLLPILSIYLAVPEFDSRIRFTVYHSVIISELIPNY